MNDTNRKRKSSRRSSILKSTQSPARGALCDLDLNAPNLEEDVTKQSRRSRRVSFANTCQVKEFLKDSWNGNAAQGNPALVYLATGISPDEAQDHEDLHSSEAAGKISGLDVLLTGTIQSNAGVDSQSKADDADENLLVGDATIMDGMSMNMTCQSFLQSQDSDEPEKKTDTFAFLEKSSGRLSSVPNPEMDFTQCVPGFIQSGQYQLRGNAEGMEQEWSAPANATRVFTDDGDMELTLHAGTNTQWNEDPKAALKEGETSHLLYMGLPPSSHSVLLQQDVSSPVQKIDFSTFLSRFSTQPIPKVGESSLGPSGDETPVKKIDSLSSKKAKQEDVSSPVQKIDFSTFLSRFSSQPIPKNEESLSSRPAGDETPVKKIDSTSFLANISNRVVDPRSQSGLNVSTVDQRQIFLPESDTMDFTNCFTSNISGPSRVSTANTKTFNKSAMDGTKVFAADNNDMDFTSCLSTTQLQAFQSGVREKKLMVTGTAAQTLYQPSISHKVKSEALNQDSNQDVEDMEFTVALTNVELVGIAPLLQQKENQPGLSTLSLQQNLGNATTLHSRTRTVSAGSDAMDLTMCESSQSAPVEDERGENEKSTLRRRRQGLADISHRYSGEEPDARGSCVLRVGSAKLCDPEQENKRPLTFTSLQADLGLGPEHSVPTKRPCLDRTVCFTSPSQGVDMERTCASSRNGVVIRPTQDLSGHLRSEGFQTTIGFKDNNTGANMNLTCVEDNSDNQPVASSVASEFTGPGKRRQGGDITRIFGSSENTAQMDLTNFHSQILSVQSKVSETEQGRESNIEDRNDNMEMTLMASGRTMGRPHPLDREVATSEEYYRVASKTQIVNEDKTTEMEINRDSEGLDQTLSSIPINTKALDKTKIFTGDMTMGMEMTTCVGKIMDSGVDETSSTLPTDTKALDKTKLFSGDMTMGMEMTTCVGKIMDSGVDETSSTLPTDTKALDKTKLFSGDMTMGMEMTTCVGKIMDSGVDETSSTLPTDTKALDKTKIFSGDMTMGMEMTTCVGKIMDSGVEETSTLPTDTKALDKTKIFSGDMTMGMEMTTCIGKIMDSERLDETSSTIPSSMKVLDKTKIFSGDMTMGMEMTTCLGKIATSSALPVSTKVFDKTKIFTGDMTIGMEMTTCVGEIMDSGGLDQTLSTIPTDTKTLDKTKLFSGDMTMGMEMTTCVGKIMESEGHSKTSFLPTLLNVQNINSSTKKPLTCQEPFFHNTNTMREKPSVQLEAWSGKDSKSDNDVITEGVDVTTNAEGIEVGQAEKENELVHLPRKCDILDRSVKTSGNKSLAMNMSTWENLVETRSCTQTGYVEPLSVVCPSSTRKLSFFRPKLLKEYVKPDSRSPMITAQRQDVGFQLPSVRTCLRRLSLKPDTAALSSTFIADSRTAVSRARHESNGSTADSIGIMEESPPPEFTLALVDTSSYEQTSSDSKNSLLACQELMGISYGGVETLTAKDSRCELDDHDRQQAESGEARGAMSMVEVDPHLTTGDNFDGVESFTDSPVRKKRCVTERAIRSRGAMSDDEEAVVQPHQRNLSRTLPLQSASFTVRQGHNEKAMSMTLPDMEREHKDNVDSSQLAKQSSFRCNGNTSQGRSHLSMIETELLQSNVGRTVEDYFKLLNIYTLGQRISRRSSIKNLSVPDGLAGYIKCATIQMPQIDSFEWATQEMTVHDAKLDAKISVVSDAFLKNPPQVFDEILNMVDRTPVERKYSAVRKACDLTVKARFKTWSCKLVTAITEQFTDQGRLVEDSLIQQRQQIDRLDKAQEAVKEVEEQLEVFDFTESETPEERERLETLNAHLQQIQKDYETKKHQLDQLKEQQTKSSQEKNQLEEQLEEMDKQLLEMSEPTSQDSDLVYLWDTKRNIELLTEWRLKGYSRKSCHFSFFFDTLHLKIYFGPAPDEDEDGQPITNIMITSNLADDSPEFAHLSHRYIHTTVEPESLLRRYCSRHHLSDMLADISVTIITAQSLAEDIIDVELLHQTTIQEFRVTVEFSSLKAFTKFLLIMDMSPAVYPLSRLSWSMSTKIGDLREDDLRPTIESVMPGFGYLSRVVEAIDNFLEIKPLPQLVGALKSSSTKIQRRHEFQFL